MMAAVSTAPGREAPMGRRRMADTYVKMIRHHTATIVGNLSGG
jgi:hypothetical protein